MKKVLIISSTMRVNGNSEILSKEFLRGASEVGNEVEFISLRDLSYDFCKGCLYCQKTGKCFMNDDIKNVIEKFRDSDVIVLATPIYYYSVSGQLKTFLDRMNPLYISDYRFKDFYLLASCADESESAMETAIKDIDGFITCFSGTSLKQSLCATSTNNVADIEAHRDILNKAYEMGKNI